MRATLALLLAGLALSPAFAGKSKIGTSGAQFLRIGAGARPTAMGDAYTAIGGDVNSSYFNPAGLATLRKAELTAMHTQYFQGIDYSYGAFAIPASFGTFAFSAATLQTSDIKKYGADETPYGTFNNLDAAYGLSFGTDISEAVSFGGTARYIRESIDSNSATAWGGDLGVMYADPDSNYSYGFAGRHFGQAIKFQDEGDPQPLVLDLGAAGHYFAKRLTIGANILSPRDNNVQFGLGAEWKQGREDRFRYAVRGGFHSFGTDAGGATGLSLGGGLGYKRLDFDVAWVPFGDLGNTFRYAILVHF